MSQAVCEAGRAVMARAGKYLTFQLGAEVYGLAILKVQEIIGIMNVTQVPRTPPFVRGVINLRGKVIPVVDLRQKFNLDVIEDTERTCIIVVQVSAKSGDITMGIIVDEVSEVLDVKTEQLEPPPSFGASVDTDFILGMGKANGKVTILLDIVKVMAGSDLTAVAGDAA